MSSSSDGPSLIYRLFTRVIIVVGVVAALWFGIHVASQQQSGPPRDVSTSSPWQKADPTAEARGVTVRR